MPIPDYQQFMLPLLQFLSDGTVRTRRECNEWLANHFHLSSSDREELLPSGRTSVLDNRAGWAATYLTKAGLLRRPQRGRCQITARGRDALTDASNGKQIDTRYLRQFPEFEVFQRGNEVASPALESPESGPIAGIAGKSPQEHMEAAHQELRAVLASDLLDRIRSGSPRFFERLVLDLLVAMGYGGSRADAAQAVGGSGDGGVDGYIKEDKLGLDSIYLQAKRWEGPVGRPVVQTFAGSLEGFRARKGVLITTSKFSQEAQDYVRRIEKRIVLIDGEQLTNLMIDHGVGVADVVVYSVKRVDEDYFEEA